MASEQMVLRRNQQPVLQKYQTTINRHQQPILQKHATTINRGRIGEVAGGTAAEVAAVACCCPATAVNLAVLVVYKVPAGICRKALKERKRKRLIRKGMLPRHSRSYSEEALKIVDEEDLTTMVVVEGSQMDQELIELEEEMWERFDRGGFWRSPSKIEHHHHRNNSIS